MFQAPKSPFLVPFDDSFRIKDAATSLPKGERLGKKEAKAKLAKKIKEVGELQRKLYADDHHAVLLVFQAMDAAGKDGTIRAVMSGINPAGCQVYSFKQPSSEELDHDFMWRTNKALPERGRIGIFNRSYYEEVLVVRVHPEILGAQNLPGMPEDLGQVWAQRYDSIRDQERHLARNGTVILKFWLHVSREEQKQRFLKRIDDSSHNWKFSMSDVTERGYWKDYMAAYQDALNATSRPWAPWYAIPADDKPMMRLKVAEILVETLKSLDLSYPTLPEAEQQRLEEAKQKLLGEKG